MNRDEIKKILGENASDEQITNVLNALHGQTNTLKKEIDDLKANQSKYSDYDEIKNKLEEINRANMTEQEKLAKEKEEIANNLRQSRIIKNKAKVLEILAGKGLDDEIIDTLVNEDENISLAKAQKLASQLDAIVETTKKKTQEEIANLDVKPNITNSNPNDDVMNWDKFSQLSLEEQNKFAVEHPNEFANL